MVNYTKKAKWSCHDAISLNQSVTDRKCKRSFGATPAAAPAPASPTGRPTVRTALPCRPERRGCLARAPRSQAEHGAAWRWLGLDRRRRMGEGSAQGWLAGVPRRARLAPPDRAPGHPDRLAA